MFDPADMELDMVDEVRGSLFTTVSFHCSHFFFFLPCRIELKNDQISFPGRTNCEESD